ncbi:unnamed protein product [Phytomonas sp. Hart1]|nr:unnamed protein product [Phytomonas sp. Hart1]|eukprot:CCW71586.1 unnamed protein product [Phytomonas sp. isolate Hart1]
MGRLEVRVCAALNVGNIQKIGKVDPYVKVKLQEQRSVKVKYRTRVVENSLDPVWDELFKFKITDSETTQMLFELWNDNISVGDLLGSCRLSLNEMKRGVVQDKWVILTGRKFTTAELHLRVLAVDFGHEPGPGDAVLGSLEEDTPAVPANQTIRLNTNANEKMSRYPINLRPPSQIVVNQPQYKPSTIALAQTWHTRSACYGNSPLKPMYIPGPHQFAGPALTVQDAYGVSQNM